MSSRRARPLLYFVAQGCRRGCGRPAALWSRHQKSAGPRTNRVAPRYKLQTFDGTSRLLPSNIDTLQPVSYHENFMDESTPAIEIQNLRKLYGSKAAVDGLTLTVPRGSFFG